MLQEVAYRISIKPGPVLMSLIGMAKLTRIKAAANIDILLAFPRISRDYVRSESSHVE